MNSYWWIPTIALGVLLLIQLVIWAYFAWAPARDYSPAAKAPPPPPPTPPTIAIKPQPARRPPSPPSDLTELDNQQQFSVLTGPLQGQNLPLPSNNFGIGRYLNVESNILLALDEKSISRNHALWRIDSQTGESFIQDVGSSFGTYLVEEGGLRRIEPNYEERVYDQDVLQFGNLVQVRVSLNGSSQPEDSFKTQL